MRRHFVLPVKTGIQGWAPEDVPAYEPTRSRTDTPPAPMGTGSESGKTN